MGMSDTLELWELCPHGLTQKHSMWKRTGTDGKCEGGKKLILRLVDCGHTIHVGAMCPPRYELRSEEHTSELQSHSFISYAVFCLKKKKKN